MHIALVIPFGKKKWGSAMLQALHAWIATAEVQVESSLCRISTTLVGKIWVWGGTHNKHSVKAGGTLAA